MLDPNWHSGGGSAWSSLYRKELRGMVNTWLSNKDLLRTPYRIEVREFIPETDIRNQLPGTVERIVHDAIVKFIRESAEGGGSGESVAVTASELRDGDGDADVLQPALLARLSSFIDADEEARKIVDDLMTGRESPMRKLILVDQRTQTPVSHRDVGIGISQLLPVLVNAFSGSGGTTVIEQPEIHLHPGLQAELADVFLQSASLWDQNQKRRCRFVLEVHSEHLILRMLRRVRETTANDPNSLPFDVKPEDIQVLYVQPTQKGSVIHSMQITPDGDFAQRWPEGFFDERAKELF